MTGDTESAGNEDAVETLSASEMRAVERAAIGSGKATGLELMERAGAGVVAALDPGIPAGHAVVLCGPGNNGGDGYVIARLLHQRGWRVSVFALGTPANLPGDALSNYRRWCETGAVRPLAEAEAALPGADLVVDALFGIGLARPLADEIGQVFEAIPASARTVAVDVPSGWDTDAAKPLGRHVFPAALTVTFHALKPVHHALRSQGSCVRLVDIGL